MLQFAAPADSLTFTAAIQSVGSGGLTAHIDSVWAVAVRQHISTVCGQWRSDSTYQECVGSGGLTAAIQCVGSGGLTAHINSVWAVAV